MQTKIPYLFLWLFCGLIAHEIQAQKVEMPTKIPIDDILDASKRSQGDLFQLTIQFFEKNVGFGLDDVEVKLFNMTKNTHEGGFTEGGEITFSLEPGCDYEILGIKKRFINSRSKLEACHLTDPTLIFCASGFGWLNYADGNQGKSKGLFAQMELDRIDFDKAYRVQNIYYDLDKWDIRSDAKPSLDRLVQLLKDNTDIKIELSSHTDSRGSDSYNEILSQKRAESAVQYIVLQGISPDIVTAKGYGETKLVNHCTNGKNCAESLHQQNRRTEFRIIDLLLEGEDEVTKQEMPK